MVDYNPAVLKNKGFPVKVYRLDVNGERDLDGDENPIEATMWVRFTNADLAVLEEPAPTGWGGLEAWETALQDTTYLTLAKTWAILRNMFDTDNEGRLVPQYREAAKYLIDGKADLYVTTITGAVLISQGTDPLVAAQVVDAGLKQSKDSIDRSVKDILTRLTEANFPGSTGSVDGANSDETQTPSGD